MKHSVQLLNLPLFAWYLVLLLVVGGLFANLMLTMPFYKVISLKMISWHNHQVLLIVILPIYSLKQAPRAWYYELRQFLVTSRFTNSHADTSLFIFNTSGNLVYLLVYVDDIIITGCNATTAQYFIDLLGKRFSIKDLGDLSYFLGIEVATTSIGLLLSHRKYIIDLFARTNMTEPNLSQLFLPPSPHLQFFSALL